MYLSDKSKLFEPLLCIGKYALLITFGLLVACGKKTSEEKASQSIVRINGDEITMYQINSELQRINPKPDQMEATTKLVTGALIDRQVLFQAAKKNDIDRKPRVVQAIENAKMQIISQSYLEDKISLKAKPSNAEISDYYSQHSDIFANRKIYTIEELSFKVDSSLAQEYSVLMNSAKSSEDVVLWLDKHQTKYTQNRSEHASESIPTPLLSKLEKMAIGDSVFTNSNDENSFLRIVNLENASISEVAAKPIIEQILFNQKRTLIIDSEIKHLHSLANIEYLNKKFQPPRPIITSESEQTLHKTVKPTESIEVKDRFEKVISSLK
jgi:EpsD family peptidyl-prolyl cis-trans isomerase